MGFIVEQYGDVLIAIGFITFWIIAFTKILVSCTI